MGLNESKPAKVARAAQPRAADTAGAQELVAPPVIVVESDGYAMVPAQMPFNASGAHHISVSTTTNGGDGSAQWSLTNSSAQNDSTVHTATATHALSLRRNATTKNGDMSITIADPGEHVIDIEANMHAGARDDDERGAYFYEHDAADDSENLLLTAERLLTGEVYYSDEEDEPSAPATASIAKRHSYDEGAERERGQWDASDVVCLRSRMRLGGDGDEEDSDDHSVFAEVDSPTPVEVDALLARAQSADDVIAATHSPPSSDEVYYPFLALQGRDVLKLTERVFVRSSSRFARRLRAGFSVIDAYDSFERAASSTDPNRIISKAHAKFILDSAESAVGDDADGGNYLVNMDIKSYAHLCALRRRDKHIEALAQRFLLTHCTKSDAATVPLKHTQELLDDILKLLQRDDFEFLLKPAREDKDSGGDEVQMNGDVQHAPTAAAIAYKRLRPPSPISRPLEPFVPQ